MIRLSSHLITRLEEETRTAVPEEACGLLIGQVFEDHIHIEKILMTENVAITPTMGFEVDPNAHMQLQKHLRGREEDIVGVFHSHPTGVTSPSLSDIEEAQTIGWVWMISALGEKGDFRLQAFRHKHPDGDKFIEEEIALTDKAP